MFLLNWLDSFLWTCDVDRPSEKATSDSSQFTKVDVELILNQRLNRYADGFCFCFKRIKKHSTWRAKFTEKTVFLVTYAEKCKKNQRKPVKVLYFPKFLRKSGIVEFKTIQKHLSTRCPRWWWWRCCCWCCCCCC